MYSLISGISFNIVSVMRYEPRDFDGRVMDFWNQDMVPAGEGRMGEDGGGLVDGCGK